jgi:streptomycin 6-kinase
MVHHRPVDQGRRLLACRLLWSLRLGGRLTGGSRATVLDALGTDGTSVVLKLCRNREVARVEAAALRRWSATGAAVRLVDVDEGLGALLLERLQPGTPLPRGPVGVAVAADLLAAMHDVDPGGHGFAGLSGTSAAEVRQARQDLEHERRTRGEPDRARAAEEALPAAAALLERLADDRTRRVLLHGDFLTKNVLRAPHGYRVVDPLPRIGDPCSDAGMFASDQVAGSILDVAGSIADRLGLDAERVVAWATVWTILQAAQAWRPDQERLDELVASREVRRVLAAG